MENRKDTAMAGFTVETPVEEPTDEQLQEVFEQFSAEQEDEEVVLWEDEKLETEED